MKLQHMIIIFLIIMLPLALIMSQYTKLQIDTLNLKTKYDTALLSATFDTMAAFELNTINSDASSVVGEEIRDLEAVISTFTTSLSSGLGMSNSSSDIISNYVPAIVFGLYDGYYIYAQNDTGTGRELKPYVYYTKTYIRDNTNITIAYSLDNYVSVYGLYNGKSISKSGYLIAGDVEISPNFTYVITADEEKGTIKKVVDPGTKAGGQTSWIQYKGYDICKETIYENETVSSTDGMIINKPKETTEAMMYYYEAANFTKLYNEVVSTLNISDKNTLYIDSDNDPEDENSLFMNEKINVIKDSITKNLNNAIYNYEGGVSENYEMPQLKGEDWEKILNNISITAFLKDIPVGATQYNNYVVVNSTTNKKYNSAKSIDFIEYVNNVDTGINSYGYYHNITCDELINDLESGVISDIIGYASTDFERYRYTPTDENDYYYYYKHNEYADYNCEVETIKSQNVATIESDIMKRTSNTDVRKKILKAYYTAIGRVRYDLIKASSYINLDEIKSFKVRYFPNGGTWSKGNPETVTTSIGRLQVISETPRINGKTFMGWSTNPHATVADIKLGDTIYRHNNSTIDLYAVYANQYAITYYTNGGEGGPTPNVQTKVSGIDYIIPNSKPTKSNSVFLGWSTNPSATTPEYVAGDVYEKDANLNLYAVWTNQMVKIYYNTKGGSIVPTQEKAVGATIKLEGTPILVGSTFKGWSTTQTGRIPEYLPGSDYSENVDKTLYAIWETTTFRITYNANGGQLSSDLQNISKCTKLYGIGYIILTSKPTREGYSFIGWSRNPNASVGENDYAPGKVYTANADLTLYAVWEGEQYSVAYNANGGENEPETQTTTKDKDIKITNKQPTREGYEFLGWSTSQDMSNTQVQYKPGDIYKGRTSIRLYAVWRQAVYTITYDTNGGSPTPSTQTKKHGENIHITSTQPSKANSYFVGWTTEKNSKTVQYYTNQVYREDKSITLYAVWNSEYYDIIYDANGGAGGPESVFETQIGTSVVISSVKPTREGYTFLGWSTNKYATTPDNAYAPGKTYSGPASIELYAVWGKGQITLTVDADRGTWRGKTGVTTLSVATDDTFTLEVPVPPTGYSFAGWDVITGDAFVSHISGNSYSVTIGVLNSNIKAIYEPNKYLITYNKNTTASVTNMPASSYEVYNTNVRISSLIPTRAGYQFLGWSTNPSSATPEYTAGASFVVPSRNVTLYAVWKINHVHSDSCYHHHVDSCYSKGQYMTSSSNINVCPGCGKTYSDWTWACHNCSWTGISRTSYCTCGQNPHINQPIHNDDKLICGKTESTLECGYP